MNFRPKAAHNARGVVTFERSSHHRFLKPIWVREWRHQGRHGLGLRRSLRSIRVLPGLGVDDPYEIRLERSVLSSRTVADGFTLGEALSTGRLSNRESFVRGMLDQLLLGLARLHDGLAECHGHLGPDSIRISPDGRATLWAFPTAEWDHSELSAPGASRSAPHKIGARILNEPARYCAPDGEPTPASDIYSLCKISLDLLRGLEVSEELTAILRAGTSPEPLRRPSLPGLARALNPNTLLAGLDVIRGLARRQAGLTAYHRGDIERAEELWQEARDYDCFSAVVWNNLAVVEMARGRFEEALENLHKARGLCTSHPLIASNLAHCHRHLDALEASEFWARQANTMNPELSQPYLCLSLLYQSRGLADLAAGHAYQAVALAPKDPAARIQLAQTYDQMGAAKKALGQWKKVKLLSKTKPFEANLIDELKEPPWGNIRSSYGNVPLSPRSP